MKTITAKVKTIIDINDIESDIIERKFLFEIRQLDKVEALDVADLPNDIFYDGAWEITREVDDIPHSIIYKTLNSFDPDNRDHIGVLISEFLEYENVVSSKVAALLGRRGGLKGGKAKSKEKQAAARLNGLKGGRPKSRKSGE